MLLVVFAVAILPSDDERVDCCGGADHGYGKRRTEEGRDRLPEQTNNQGRKWRWLFQVISYRDLHKLRSNWAWSGESPNKTAFVADEKPLPTKSSAPVVRYRRAVVLEIACGFGLSVEKLNEME
jgi:hypothetical protein